MVNINGYEIKSAFSGGAPLKAIYSLGEKVWPTGPEPIDFGGLKFTALESGEIGMSHYGTNATTTIPNLSYSKNGGNWVEWDYTPIPVDVDDVIYFKGINDSIGKSSSDYSNFTSNCNISVSGNIMSLLYGDDFIDKNELKSEYTFCRLFYENILLYDAVNLILPATTLTNNCYTSMFEGCYHLTETPELPATTLADYCYSSMFLNCLSLNTSPILPSTTLTNHCYYKMFMGCTKLTTAPVLTSTTLGDYCYNNMFFGCSSLVEAPELPATTLTKRCYYAMFSGCSKLTNSPELPATTLVDGCYTSMFRDCTNLNYVKANFTTTPSTTYTNNWLYGVSETGTFDANPDATWINSFTKGPSTVPEGWTIKTEPEPEPPTPISFGGLKFTALEAGTIGMTHSGTNATTTKPKLSYSKNGYDWVDWDYSPISVNSGDVVYFKGVNNSISSISSSLYNSSTFTSTGKFEASGNIMSLIYGDNYEGQVSLSGKDYCFESLFSGCTGITTAPELPSTTLSTGCYYYMFSGCTSLTTAPELPATTLETWCCYGMFSGCTSLTTAPELHSTTLKYYCYNSMFYGCTNLTTAPELPATTLSDGCYAGMFSGCTSLTTAPELPATTLSDGCYNYMFKGCTSLTTAPELPANTLVKNCYYGMFYNCTNLNYVKANFTTTPSSNYTDSWLDGVASTGTFVANPSATWTTSITRGPSTVPAGWTITK